MQRFHFSMQVLYDVKKAGEKQALTELTAARDRLRQVEEKTEVYRAVLGREQSQLSIRAKRGIAACDFQNACAYLGGLQQKVISLEEEKSRAQAAVQERQQALREIHQGKRALEHLRDTQYRNFMEEQEAREAKEIEDLLMPRMVKGTETRDDPA